MAEPIDLRGFLGTELANKYLGHEPVDITDWGHEDCSVCEAARERAMLRYKQDLDDEA